jgi:hypothetical protein
MVAVVSCWGLGGGPSQVHPRLGEKSSQSSTHSVRPEVLVYIPIRY